MKKSMKKSMIMAGAVMFALPAVAAASGGIQGQCADCHTMHNSFEGAPVAVQGLNTTPSGTPNQNLLKMDCIACHAQDPDGPKLAVLDGGSTVPQVYHGDASDLAGGNFKHITDGGDSANRKGHNVIDLFGVGDSDNGGAYGSPPGKYYESVHGNYFSPGGVAFANFTCAGSVGCHGTRSQMLSGYTDPNDTTTGNTEDGPDFWVTTAKRRGIPAVSGAHHNSFDGKKDPAATVMDAGVHDGAKVAASYRFIKGLKGTGSPVRWQNVDSANHNEYFGNAANPNAAALGCNTCHSPGNSAVNGGNARMTLDSTLKVPNQSMSGFCVSCHGNFHSSATENGAANRFEANGVSGAFLRHPSDYVIPDRGEYAAYTTYNVTAPVARPTLLDAASADVTPGVDMVMCLSCHKPHATEYNGMLRFDYQAIVAGNTAANDGCLACHTTKGVLPENR